MQLRQTGWARIVEAIDKPLGFYVLALLIVEGFLALVLTLSELQDQAKERGMWAGVGLFLIVVLVVTVCVWKKPTHLTFTERGSLTQMGKMTYGSGTELAPDNMPKGQHPPQEKA